MILGRESALKSSKDSMETCTSTRKNSDNITDGDPPSRAPPEPVSLLTLQTWNLEQLGKFEDKCSLE
jgi:hypothetical protein